MEKVNDEISLLDAIGKLIEAQRDLAILSVAEKRKEIRNAVKGKFDSIVKSLKEQESIYGANSEQRKDIEKEYNEKLALIRQDYESYMEKITADKMAIQEESLKKAEEYSVRKKYEKEQKKTPEYKEWKKEYDMMKSSAVAIGKKGREASLNMYKTMMKELREFEKKSPLYANSMEMKKIKDELAVNVQKVKDIEKDEQDLKKEVVEAIDRADGEKETALTKLKPQNAFQKFVGGVLNKIGGKQKFERNVIEPLKYNLKNFKEQVIPGFVKAATGITKATIGETKLAKSIMVLIDASRNAKIDALNKAKGKIMGKTENINQKIENIKGKEENTGMEL